MKTYHYKKRKLEIYDVAKEELESAKEQYPDLSEEINKIYQKKEEMDHQRKM